jgi:hypothetical protein
MKLVEEVINVQSQGVQESQSYAIESSAKAFLVLSDRLYSNKILAVVRELSTNASESHIEAGNKDIPFDVLLPSNIDPNFVIRDYGLGLSHEDCMSLYRTYFKSTKSDKNTVGGCLGLGSKSPFAYTDSFSVVSYFNGMKRFYSGVRTTNGPEFNFMHEEETDEPNGIQVSVPVKSGDFDSFKNSASFVYKYFDVTPNFTGRQIEIEHKQITLSDDTWYVDRNTRANYVVMGQIAYPIKASTFDNIDEDISTFLRLVTGLHLNMDIGSVDITPSREELSYNPQTIDNIRAALIKVADYVDKMAEDQISSCPTLYDARIKYIDMDSLFTSGRKLTWKGQKLFDNNRDCCIDVPTALNENLSQVKSSWRKNSLDIQPAYSIKFGYNCAYVLEDTTVYKKGRLQKLVKTCGNIHLYKGDKADFIKLLGDIPEDKIILMSKLPYDAVTGRGIGSIPCSYYDSSIGGFVDSKMSVKYLDAIYVPESRGDVSFKGNSFRLAKLAELIKYFEDDLGYEFGGTFYTVKPSVIENSNLDTRSNWRSLDTVFGEALQYITETETEKFKIGSNKPSFRQIDIAKVIVQVNKDPIISSMIKDYFDRTAEYNKAAKFLEKFEFLTRYLGKVSVEYPELPNYSEEFQKIIDAKYPSITHMSYYSYDKIIPYIKDMDELNEFRRTSKILQNSFVQTVLN